MKIIRHIIIIALALFLILCLPILMSDSFRSFITGTQIDAASSASATLDSPSGEYVVLINKKLHTDKEKLGQWKTFFSGGQVSYIFEDVICYASSDDKAGIEMAQSYMSRLPENQMQLETENGVLVLSKAENGNFDVIVMSAEIAKVYGADEFKDDEDVMYLIVKSNDKE